ncbi:hypothetical protein PshuTeo2_10000 [Pseudomonas hunanensis]|uniref:UvrD-helicase domain-containing protein n=1 Tax=Pseudomonas hunanensis TaxID=1247546 RepID=UPI002AA0BD4F|nr:UvrD-helicase domain-containing protein [Pseudomonas hunanensis]MDY7070959.1 hypothetical protein [Pseudomonas hunanensis]HDS0957242.1 UvrD-helicase domain-containing protein [Pseudomonas putida]
MDKSVILAVAGSGKTTYLVNSLDTDKRFLIITYTINNVSNLRAKIAEKFQCLPQNIYLVSYFNFLYSFCYKPTLHYKVGAKGINFEPCKNRFAMGISRYRDPSFRLYSNRLAKLLDEQGAMGEVLERISKYFDYVFVDEVQDFAGHDFNFLKSILAADTNVVCVGDYFQHTFDTSRDGPVNRTLHDDFASYKKQFKKIGVEVDEKTLKKSHRCSPTVCNYVSGNLGIQIHSNRMDETTISFIEKQSDADDVFSEEGIVKLFYQDRAKYPGHARNWGETKGEDRYKDVCIVLNPTTLKSFKDNNLANLNPQTRNKLYVALTRAKGDIHFVPEALLKKYKSTSS